MHLLRNKKSLVKNYIVLILLISASFLILFAILEIFKNKAEAKTSESICKGSVALREKSYTEVRDPVIGLKLGSVATPLLCQTIEKYLPEDKKASSENIQKDFADLMASCWNIFGEGVIKDVFKQGDAFRNNCFMCYTVSLRETSKFKNKDEIKTKQFSRYLFETPYKVSSKSDNCRIDGGFCIESSNIDDCREKIDVDESYLLVKKNNECKKNGKNSCCYTDYECWNNGGECTTINPDTDTYRQYDKWSCPSKMDCYVKKEDYYSYGEYIQRFGGDGIITLLTDIKPGETYAISFGSPTETCNWCTKLGIHLGAAATMGILLAVSNPVGWTILIGAGIAGGITYATVRTVSKLGADAYRDYIQQREFPTIYLTTLSQIQEEDLCTMVKEV